MKIKQKSGFFATVYLKEFFTRPRVPLSNKGFKSYIFSKLIEMPITGILWLASKMPFIGKSIEKIIALRISNFWKFKPIPLSKTLSEEALKYKKEKIIEIEKKIDINTKILDIATFNEIIERFPFSVVAECGCRSTIMHCDAPKHTCLVMRWPMESDEKIWNFSKFQKVSKEELEKVLDLSDRWALVRMALTFPDQERTYVICNCCDCCCISFREFKTYAAPIIVGAKYVAKIDTEKCSGCFYCINYRCRFRAILKVNEDGTIIDPLKEDLQYKRLPALAWSEKRNGWGLRIRKDPPNWEKIKKEHSGKWFAKIDPNRCFGCGNCASPKYGCPEGAIKLYPRKN
ncbi:MAG: hypothetical protein ACTSQS_17245 [Promethearchaeota archaeon]